MKKFKLLLATFIAVLAMLVGNEDVRAQNNYTDYNWNTCTHWAQTTFSNGKYVVRNNSWGSGAQQCIGANSESQWGSWSWHSNSGYNVKSYPQCIRGWAIGNGYMTPRSQNGMGMHLNDLHKAKLYWKMEAPSSGVYMALFDLYFHRTPNPGGEKANFNILLFTHNRDNYGHSWGVAGESLSYAHTEFYIDGHPYRMKVTYSTPSSASSTENAFIVWVGPFSSTVTGNPESPVIDLRKLLDHIQSLGHMQGDVYFTGLHHGYEIIQAPHPQVFKTLDYWDALNNEPEGGGGSTPPDPIPVNGVSVSPTSATINAGSTQQLTATVSPTNATNKNVTWASSNPSVATVNSTGLVTGVAAGSATITVTTQDGNKTATSNITVNPPPAPGANLLTNGDFSNGLTGWTFMTNGATATAGVTNGEAVISITSAGTNLWQPQLVQQLALVGGQEYVVSFRARAVSNRSIQVYVNSNAPNYSNYNTQVVNLTTTMQTFTYTFTAPESNSNARIDFNMGGNNANVYLDDVSVSVPGSTTVPVTSVSVSPTSATVNVGATQQLTATVLPADATNKNVSWSSSNTAVATVSSSGLVTAVAAGSATITVTTQDGNRTATSAITVPTQTVPVTGVSVSPTSATLNVGATQQLTATVLPADATNKNVSWSSNNTTVATVNSSGLVTAVAAGSATITVTTQDGNRTATSAITVQEQASGLATIVSAVAGASEAGNPPSNSYDNNNTTRWANDGTVANAWIEYTLDGTYDITGISLLMFNHASRTYPIEVSINGVVVWSGNTAISSGFWDRSLTGTGNRVRIRMTGNNSNGHGWFSIFEVRINGTISSGTIPVNSVSVSPATATLEVGATQQLTATVLPADATNKNVSWSSSNTSVATVNASGLVTAIAAGSATITVTTQDGNKTAACAVTITAPPGQPTNLVLNPGFESGGASWTINSPFVVSTVDKRSGDNSLRMNGTNSWGIAFQTISVTPNTNYTLSAYVKGNGRVFCKVFTSGWTDIAERFINPTSGWVKYSLDFNSGNNSSIIISFMDAGSGTSYIDDVELVVDLTKSSAVITNVESTALEGIQIYPNPVRDGVLKIQLDGIETAHAFIYDMAGRLSRAQQLQDGTNSINVEGLNSGLYILRISTHDNVTSHRFIINR